MIPVSVVIVTKDEEKNIEEALKSVSDAKEIVIVDSFSSDRTVEICKAYTDKIFQHKWEGFALQKQKAVDYAKGPWILILDADERLTSTLRDEILEILTNTDFDGFYIPRKNFFLNKWIRHSGWWPDYTLRLFKKDKAFIEEREVHEKVVVDGKVGYFKNPLEHYSYRTISDFVKKMENYSTLAAKEFRKNSGSSNIFFIIAKPIFTFVKMFFLRLGFLDGVQGLILAVFYSFYTFLKYVKVWENKSNR